MNPSFREVCINEQAGAFAYMPARLEHAIRARTEVVMLLTLLKQPSAA